jgi:hypothetical protein
MEREFQRILKRLRLQGMKARKTNKKKAKLEKIQEATENIWKASQTGTSEEAGSQDSNLAATQDHAEWGFTLTKLYDHWRHLDH